MLSRSVLLRCLDPAIVQPDQFVQLIRQGAQLVERGRGCDRVSAGIDDNIAMSRMDRDAVPGLLKLPDGACFEVGGVGLVSIFVTA